MSARPTYPFKGNVNWYYQRIRPEFFHLNDVLFELKVNRAARRELLDAPDAYLAAQGIEGLAVEALKELDITKLNAAGGHPILGWTVILLLRYDKGDTHVHAAAEKR
jgi:hypothetical protein